MKSNFAALLDICQHHKYPRWRTYWHRLVHEYTANQLTFDSDKWAAISGLVRLVEQTSNKELLHGLWKDDLIDELLWFARGPGRRLQSEAPSWSWLSLDRAIDYNPINFASWTATILSGERRSLASKGLNQSNQITVQAPMSKFQSNSSSSRGLRFMFKPNRGDTYVSWDPDVFPKESSEVWALRLNTKSENGEITWCAGLAVVSTDESHRRWVRVGISTHSSPRMSPEKTTPFSSYVEETKTIVLV